MMATIRAVGVGDLIFQYLDEGHGEVILYLHGAGGRPPNGASFVYELAIRHRVVLPSRPGFDGTPEGSYKTTEDVADVVAAFLDRLAIGSCHVIGQSAGAAVACWLALRHPHLTKSLVLSAPSTFAVRPPQEGLAPPTDQEIERRLYGDRPHWSQVPMPEEQKRIQDNASLYLARMHQTGGNEALLARLSEIALPTLLLLGTGDRVMLPESGTPFQKHIASCHRIFLYGAAHELPISAGPTWTNIVSEFIDRGEAFVVNRGPTFAEVRE
jgi:pimeloyl-ACP methyl ester carboxylesterase